MSLSDDVKHLTEFREWAMKPGRGNLGFTGVGLTERLFTKGRPITFEGISANGCRIIIEGPDLQAIARVLVGSSNERYFVNEKEIVDASFFQEDTPLKQEDLTITSGENTGKAGHCAEKAIKFREFL